MLSLRLIVESDVAGSDLMLQHTWRNVCSAHRLPPRLTLPMFEPLWRAGRASAWIDLLRELERIDAGTADVDPALPPVEQMRLLLSRLLIEQSARRASTDTQASSARDKNRLCVERLRRELDTVNAPLSQNLLRSAA